MNDKVRDLRRKEKFVVDDEYLNGMARICGANATIVYMSLCRHASKTQTCFPSLKLMSEQHGVCTRTILRGIKKLEERNVIKVGKKRTKDGKWLNNSYTLLDKSVWNYDNHVTNSHMDHVTNMYEPCDKYVAPHVTNSHTKGTHIKEAHKKDSNEVAKVIKLFELVDKKNKTYYGNTTQRSACQFLLDEYGIEEIERRVKVLPQTNVTPYFPRIYTPFDLKEKWGKLEDALTSKKIETISKKPIVI